VRLINSQRLALVKDPSLNVHLTLVWLPVPPRPRFALLYKLHKGFLGVAAVWRRTHDQKVAGSTPGWGAKSIRSTQPTILLG